MDVRFEFPLGLAKWTNEVLSLPVFARLAIFRPGVIVGNAHTQAWAVGWEASCLDRLAILISEFSVAQSVAEIAAHSREAGEVTRENAAMKKLAAQFSSVP
jgi:hypothetical protein